MARTARYRCISMISQTDLGSSSESAHTACVTSGNMRPNLTVFWYPVSSNFREDGVPMGPAGKLPSSIQDAMGSAAPFLAVDTSSIFEKYRIQTLCVQGGLVLAFLAAVAVAIYSEFH